MAANTIARPSPAILAQVGESAHSRQRDPGNIDPSHTQAGTPRACALGCLLGLGGLEPGPRIDRLTALADLEIKLGAGAPAAIPGGSNRVARRNLLTRSLVQPLVVAIEAQVAIAVVDDGEQSEARKPVGIDHPALAHRPDRRAAFGG